LYRETVTSKQMGGWFATAFCPVAVQLAAGRSLSTVVVAGVLSLLAACAVWRWGRFGRWTSVPALLLLIASAGQLLEGAAQVWPGNSYPAVPLILLALAVWGAMKGAQAAARVGCVLFWGVIISYLLVFGAALGDVRWEWTGKATSSGKEFVVLVMLFPLGRVVLRERKCDWRLALPAGAAVAGNVLTAGVLGIGATLGFYEMVKSIDLLGTLKHFEALIYAGATLGWYGLCSWLLSISGGLGEMIGGNGRWCPAVTAGGITIWMLLKLHIGVGLLVVLTAVFWVLIPILAQALESVKKLKKSKIDP